MKKLISALIILVFSLQMLVCGFAEVETDIIGTWYLIEYQDLDNYPGITFRGNGTDDNITVYTDGEKFLMVENNLILNNHVIFCEYSNGILDGKYKLEGDQLIWVVNYEDQDHAIYTYARQPKERQVGNYIYSSYPCSSISDFDGTWEIVKYGTYGAFVDAHEIISEGQVSFENGKMIASWIRDGNEEGLDITFNDELNKSRLYTVINDNSYIVSRLDYDTLVLDVGLNQLLLVLHRDNPISTEVVRTDSEVFDSIYLQQENWYADYDSRNMLASMLLKEAIKDGQSEDNFDLDSTVYLVDLLGHPLVICGGKDLYADYIFSVGRGTRTMEDGSPFIYYEWELYPRFNLPYSENNQDSLALSDLYVKEGVLSMLTKDIWPVEVTLD